MAGAVAGRDTTRASPCSRSVVEIWNVGSSTVAKKMSSEKNSSAKKNFSTKKNEKSRLPYGEQTSFKESYLIQE